MKLNLGCGSRHLEGWLNIDSVASLRPDRVMDLEQTPWDLPTDAADEVLLNHVLEHLGASTGSFLGVMSELHRVCRDGALIRINVPHPLHEHYRTDPSHVRPITPQTLSMFSQAECDQAAAAGSPMTPWAHILGVDFELERVETVADARTEALLRERGVLRQGDRPEDFAEIFANLIAEIRIELRVRKG
jgi:SAM-dependent methyltransferase